jgi:hypothetical protein
VDFSEARELFRIIFQVPGSDCKFLDCGLILKKPRGLSAKCLKLDFPGIIFPKETHGPSPRVRGPRRPGPPWTGGHCRAQELAGARPPAAPVPKSSDRGVGKRKGGRRTQWRCCRGSGGGGRASHRRRSFGLQDDGEGALRAKRGSVGGVGGFTEGGSTFIGRRRGGGGSSAFNGRIEGVSMVGLKAPVFGIEEGGGGEWRRLMGGMRGK